MNRKYKVAVVGATGNVGRAMLRVLAEREFPLSEIVALASKNSEGKKLSYGDEDITVQNLEQFDFAGVDFALFSAGKEVSKIYAPIAAKTGAIVIDNSSCWRMDEKVALVVPEVNQEKIDHLADYLKKRDLKNRDATEETAQNTTLAGATIKHRIIANPNCIVIPLTIALKPLQNLGAIRRVIVSTYQSVSGAGKIAMEELHQQSYARFISKPTTAKAIPRTIAFNVVPHVGKFLDNGYTDEEEKIAFETCKILGTEIAITATCVRVPVFVGHSISVNVEFYDHYNLEEIKAALESFSNHGLVLLDEQTDTNYTTPLEIAGLPAVYVSRVRFDESCNNAFNFWITSDNLLKGAALNAVQIAEILIQ